MIYRDKIYGTFELTGVLEAIINTRVFQRLRRIHQGGAVFLLNPGINQTRYEHSIGVMLLIRKLGGTMESQIAGLIHDISHTAFSHLIDYVLENEREDYHETRYPEVLADPELAAVLRQYDFAPEQFLDLELYPLLEYPLPNLSCDRIDYTLRDLFQIGYLQPKDIDWFLAGLVVYNGRVVVRSKEYAKWFQQQYEYLVREYFEGEENELANRIMKTMVGDCLARGVLAVEDFHRDDLYVIEKMEASLGIELPAHMQAIRSDDSGIELIRHKKRVIDPEILVGDRVIRLSAIN
ncbi:HD domain-containing protein [Flavilitoribacter nigricans]|uniref:Phosphohydrolase n=1 Tax=Flavilitoribacter nigricans (strain ATCC 23147 / DSM 23189 / NBRC 102662 / NCIMB 1420 / SS-2) TaxID=1122177 RepID=A0A2D0N8H3_FLAN2|nr:HD domain-containing protein [Flavilitoribacter nigricans]PHN04814.1 phosphohydrolase [Flavilitoribacter nigricans DSM 23189 = NBRC 102662]